MCETVAQIVMGAACVLVICYIRITL